MKGEGGFKIPRTRWCEVCKGFKINLELSSLLRYFNISLKHFPK